jgi:hypothetical protein
MSDSRNIEALRIQKEVVGDITKTMTDYYDQLEAKGIHKNEINEAKVNAEKISTNCMVKAAKKLEKNNQPNTIFSIEYMRLMVEVEKNIRQGNGEPPFNCYVVKHDQLDDLIGKMTAIRNTAADGELPMKMQVIVENNNHYTSMDFQVTKDGISCIVLDAANDARGIAYPAQIESAIKNAKPACPVQVHYAETLDKDNEPTGIQFDQMSCPIFTFNHACQLSHLNNIHQDVAAKSADGKVLWEKLDAGLVMDLQSNQFLTKYNNENKGKDMSLTHVRDSDGKFRSDINLNRYILDNRRSIEIKGLGIAVLLARRIESRKNYNRGTDSVIANYTTLLESRFGEKLERLPAEVANICCHPTYLEKSRNLMDDYTKYIAPEPVVVSTVSKSSSSKADEKVRLPENNTPLTSLVELNTNDKVTKKVLEVFAKYGIKTVSDASSSTKVDDAIMDILHDLNHEFAKDMNAAGLHSMKVDEIFALAKEVSLDLNRLPIESLIDSKLEYKNKTALISIMDAAGLKTAGDIRDKKESVGGKVSIEKMLSTFNNDISLISAYMKLESKVSELSASEQKKLQVASLK